MKQDTLYSIKSEVHIRADSYRISKFNDGNLESSYRTTYTECDCPAGVRPSCRHRQMLPQMIAANIVNTQFFWDFDLGRAVTFTGQLKSNIDAMNELAVEDEAVANLIEGAILPDGVERDFAEAVGEAQHVEGNPTPDQILDRAMGADADDQEQLQKALKPFVRRL